MASANHPVKPPPQSPEEVRREIERARAELVLSVDQLRHEVSGRLDWREWVRRHPKACIGGALLLGFWLGDRR